MGQSRVGMVLGMGTEAHHITCIVLVYVAYLTVRQSIDESAKSARLSAIFGIVGFISVPLSFLSIRLWRSVHPVMFGDTFYGTSGGGLEGTSIIITLLISFAAFCCYLQVFCCTDMKLKKSRMRYTISSTILKWHNPGF